MTDYMNIDGIEVEITQKDFGSGNQGKVHLGVLATDPNVPVIVKEMPTLGDAWERTQALCDLHLAGLSSAFAAPIVAETDGGGQVLHISPFALGVSWEDDVDRDFPQCLEMALQFVSLLALLEEHGISHGDIDINNFRIAPDGSISFLDWDGFVSTDSAIPPPNTIGHWRMLAPELRNSTGITPNRETDRFAMAGILTMFLMGYFATDGLTCDPAEVDDYMTRGYWPVKDRQMAFDELPIAVLGQELIDLFDLAFSVDPTVRPSPDTWRLALTRALHNCWIDDCGQAFVAEPGTMECPGCGKSITVPSSKAVLKIQITESGAHYSVEMIDRQPIILGRATISNMPGAVSGKHLQITPHADRLLLRHVGRHDTLIEYQGSWYRLDQHWVRQSDLINQQLALKLAGVEVTLKVE